MSHRLLQSVLIKPVGSFCNLKCTYCFYLDKHNLYTGPSSKHIMSMEILQKLIRDMFLCSDHPVFIWHGGEPTLAGLDFYKKVVSLQRTYALGKPYSNALQTNGILLDQAWADFFRQEKFLVGLSLDGPRHVHDQYRLDVRGKATFKRVFTKAQMLLEKKVNVNIMTTVNAYSVQYPREIYQFFRNHGFSFMQFMPVVETDSQDPDKAASFSVQALDYGKFLLELFNLWARDFNFKTLKQRTSIRFFDTLLKKYLDMPVDHCTFHKTCGNYLVVEHNGDLFSCDYLVSNDTRVGNLLETQLQRAINSSSHIAFGRRKAKLGPKCQDCQWLHLCYGGCLKDRIKDPRDQGHNRFCSSYQFFFKHADNRLKKFAKLYRRYY